MPRENPLTEDSPRSGVIDSILSTDETSRALTRLLPAAITWSRHNKKVSYVVCSLTEIYLTDVEPTETEDLDATYVFAIGWN